jgi:hypothetical protein
MGYVQSEYTALETEVFAQVRGKLVPMQVVRTPSWPHVTTAVEQEPADEPAPASRGETARRREGGAHPGEDPAHRGHPAQTRVDPRRDRHFPEVARVKALLRKHKLHSVCEEAACPNLANASPAARRPS